METYIFGYGSLINPESRARTGTTGRAIPYCVYGLRREWNFLVPSLGMSAVGVVNDFQGNCNGIIIPIPESELPKFDEREEGYKRVSLDVKSTRQFGNTVLNAWVYVPEKPQFPTLECPIVQSYVDIILVGCLQEYGLKFAKEFIKNTAGWNYPWINDRENPRYVRSLADNSQASQVDKLLQEVIPNEFSLRK